MGCEVSLLCGVKWDTKEKFVSGGGKTLKHEKNSREIVGLRSEGNVSQWNEHPRVHPAQPPALGCVSFPHRNPIILHFGVSTPLAMQHP